MRAGTRRTLLARHAVAAYRAVCTFDDPDDTFLSDYSWSNAGDVRPGANQWNSGGDIAIQSGRAVSLYTSSRLCKLIDCGVASGVLSLRVSFVNGGSSTSPRGILFRYGDAVNFFIAGFSSGNFGIFEFINSGINAQSVEPFDVSYGVDYLIEVQLAGDDMTATIDGGNTRSYSSATRNTSSIHGITWRYVGESFDTFTMI